MKTRKTNQFFTRALALVVMLLSMGVGSVWGDETLFSLSVTTTADKSLAVAKEHDLSSYATISGGSAAIKYTSLERQVIKRC